MKLNNNEIEKRKVDPLRFFDDRLISLVLECLLGDWKRRNVVFSNLRVLKRKLIREKMRIGISCRVHEEVKSEKIEI